MPRRLLTTRYPLWKSPEDWTLPITNDLRATLANALKPDRVFRYAERYDLEDDWLSAPEGCRPAHYVLVRFNLYNEAARTQAGLLDPDAFETWSLHRAELFARTARRSLEAQTARNFTVLVLMDTEIDPGAGQLIDALPTDGQFVPVFIDQRGDMGFAAFEEAVRSAIDATCGDADVIATTRLDSDDALGVGFMEVLNRYVRHVRASAVSTQEMTVNFPFGVQAAGGVLRAHLYNRNPFQTMLEPREKYRDTDKWTRKSIFQFAHDRSDKNCLVHSATTSLPMWLQVVHGGNLMNVVGHAMPQMVLTDALDAMFDGIPSGLASGAATEMGVPSGTCDTALAESKPLSHGNGLSAGAPRLRIAMTDAEAACLSRHLSMTTHYLEFGTGGSTVLAAASSVSSIVSVESDTAWIDRVRAEPDIEAREQRGEVIFHAVDIGPTGKFGHPEDQQAIDRWADYYGSVWELPESRHADLVLVDGRFRVACVLTAIANTRPGTRLLVHDFWDRPYYHAILPFLEQVEKVERMGVFRTMAVPIDTRALAPVMDRYGYDPR